MSDDPPKPFGDLSSADEMLGVRTAALVLLVSIAAAAFLGWCVSSGYSIDEQARAISIVKDLMTIVALVLGGLWTFRIYLKQRTDASALDLTQSVLVLCLPNGGWLLKLTVRLKNVGKTQVQVTEWTYRADVLLPLTDEGERMTATPNGFSERESPWPVYGEVTLTGADFGFAIEPGATQSESANLVLPADLDVVQVYTFIYSPSSRGWWDRTIIDLRKDIDHGHATTADTNSPDRNDRNEGEA